MPIDIDEFEAAGDRVEPTTSERIVRYLRSHHDRAFTRREIATAVDAAPETVGTNLTRLKRRGLVRHREPYWAIEPDAESGEEGSSTTEPATADVHDFDSATAAPHERAAATFFERVRDEVVGVDALYLFGSVARGTASPQSDVDVLAVIATDAEFSVVDDRLLDIAYDVQLDHGVTIEVHSVDADEFEARRRRGEPFVRTVVEEGVAGD